MSKLVLDATLINFLRCDKFSGHHGTTDAKSAYHWLVDKRLLPRVEPIIRFVEEERLWTVRVRIPCADIGIEVMGDSIAGTKASAERTAFAEALGHLELEYESRAQRVSTSSTESERSDDSPGQKKSSMSNLENVSFDGTGEPSSCQSMFSARKWSVTSGSSHDTAASSPFEIDLHPMSGAFGRTVASRKPEHTDRQFAQVYSAGEEYNKLRQILSQDPINPPCIVVAIDVEKDETKGSSKLLELGFDMILPTFSQFRVDCEKLRHMPKRFKWHFVVTDHLGIRNKYAAGDRDGFSHGKSKHVSEMELLRFVRLLTTWLEPYRHAKCISPLLIGHTLRQDISWLENRSLALQQSGDIDFAVNFDQVTAIDIAVVDRAVRSDFQSCKLGSIGNGYGVDFEGSPHNGGNDAVFTMNTFLAMCQKLFGVKIE